MSSSLYGNNKSPMTKVDDGSTAHSLEASVRGTTIPLDQKKAGSLRRLPHLETIERKEFRM